MEKVVIKDVTELMGLVRTVGVSSDNHRAIQALNYGRDVSFHIKLKNDQVVVGHFYGEDALSCYKEIQRLLSDAKKDNSRFRELSELLEPGKRYTLISSSEFGIGVSITRLTFEEILFTDYAQYRDAIKFVCKRKGSSKLVSTNFYGQTNTLVYEGWLPKDLEDKIDKENQVVLNENSEVRVTTYKRSSFDKGYLEDAREHILKNLNLSPLIEF